MMKSEEIIQQFNSPNPTIAPNNLLKSNSSNPSASTQEFITLAHLPCSWTSVQQAPWPPSIDRAHSSHLCKPSPPCPDLQCDGEPDLMALNVPRPFVQCVSSSHREEQGKVEDGERMRKKLPKASFAAVWSEHISVAHF